jgi:hypothetical protein
MSASGVAPRATLDLRIRVFGMGANNQPFNQYATAQNVSLTGARISGLEHELKVGDVIGIQYEAKKARCKVMWAAEAGGVKRVQVGVQLLPNQECPWISQLPEEMRSSTSVPTPDNRRRFQRHKMSFPLELRQAQMNGAMRVTAADISASGCYVQIALPLAVSARVQVDFWIDQEKVSTSGTVRTRDPGLGMGIEFTGLAEETKERFQTYLDNMNPGLSKSGGKAFS